MEFTKKVRAQGFVARVVQALRSREDAVRMHLVVCDFFFSIRSHGFLSLISFLASASKLFRQIIRTGLVVIFALLLRDKRNIISLMSEEAFIDVLVAVLASEKKSDVLRAEGERRLKKGERRIVSVAYLQLSSCLVVFDICFVGQP